MPKTPKPRVNLPLGASIQVSGAIAGGSGKIRKKIRDIQRLLKRDSIPANIRIDNERALKALHVELENAQHNLKTKENAKKYHMVRFFERKKAIRRLKKAYATMKELDSDASKAQVSKARKLVSQCEVDLAYVILFPKSAKYISIYPLNDNQEIATHDSTSAKRAEFKHEVQKMIENNKLPFLFDVALLGRSIAVENTDRAAHSHEIDAPEVNTKAEQDDFFE